MLKIYKKGRLGNRTFKRFDIGNLKNEGRKIKEMTSKMLAD